MLPHINTTTGITILVRGRPMHLAREDKDYDKILGMLVHGAGHDEMYDAMTSIRTAVEKACKFSDALYYSGGVVRYLGQPLHGYAVDKLVSMIQAEKDVRYLAKFLEKLQLNPSNQTVENLYQFLEYGKMPINERGNFLAYKAVRKDFKDIHSGTFDNSIGKEAEMPRRAVNDNREVTCSHGLHVCSFDYLPHFASANGHVMICEINPADVVSIPSDYHNTKMRVCRYTVIGEHEGYYQENNTNKDVLRDLEVWDEVYEVQARETLVEEWTVLDAYDNVDDARDHANEEFVCGGDDDEDWIQVRVLNSSGVLMYSRD